MKKYALHPGNVRSKHDGDTHYISAGALMRLYKVSPLYVVVYDENLHSRYWDEYIHLFPREDGNYKLKETEGA